MQFSQMLFTPQNEFQTSSTFVAYVFVNLEHLDIDRSV